MGKETFIIYTSFYKPISFLSDKQLGRLFRAIFRYNLGEVFEVEDDIRMAFEFFKNQLEIDEAKYQAKIMRDIENGRKGGNPNFKKGMPNPYRKKNNGDITNDNPPLLETTSNNPQLLEKTQDKAINDNDNENGNNNNPPSIPPLESGDSVADAPDASETGAEEGGKTKTWRNDYETYRQLVEEGKKALLSDKELMKKQQSYYPGVNIPLSIEKACTNYWATEAGWKNKKSKRSKEINMKMTLVNAIKNNRVYETNKTESQSYDNGGFLD